jgi:hypothetical protein
MACGQCYLHVCHLLAGFSPMKPTLSAQNLLVMQWITHLRSFLQMTDMLLQKVGLVLAATAGTAAAAVVTKSTQPTLGLIPNLPEKWRQTKNGLPTWWRGKNVQVRKPWQVKA